MLHNRVITVLGGTGFVGRAVILRLAQQGAIINVAARQISAGRRLLSMGSTGQIRLHAVDIRDEATLKPLIKGSYAVINLVGILYERGTQTFEALHHIAAGLAARISYEEGVSQFIHVSALGASLRSPSRYAQSKARGEAAIRNVFPLASILRPSLIFGPNDHFFTQFASMAALFPVLPLIGGGETRFQPVFVGDVAEAIMLLASRQVAPGTYELGGEKTYTMRELLTLMMRIMKKNRSFITLPYPIAYAVSPLLQLFPKPFLTRDQVKLLETDHILTGEESTLKAFGITPSSLEALLPTYLSRFIVS